MEKLDGIIERVIRALLKLVGMDGREKLVAALVQFVKFGLVGVTNTAVAYAINVLVLKALQPYNLSWDYVAGNIVSFIVSVLWSFYWNNKYVFTKQAGQKRSVWKALLKTYLSYGFTGIVLTNVLSYVWINLLGVSKYVAPLINLVFSIPINFIINKLWAFKTEPAEGSKR